MVMMALERLVVVMEVLGVVKTGGRRVLWATSQETAKLCIHNTLSHVPADAFRHRARTGFTADEGQLT